MNTLRNLEFSVTGHITCFENTLALNIATQGSDANPDYNYEQEPYTTSVTSLLTHPAVVSACFQLNVDLPHLPNTSSNKLYLPTLNGFPIYVLGSTFTLRSTLRNIVPYSQLDIQPNKGMFNVLYIIPSVNTSAEGMIVYDLEKHKQIFMSELWSTPFTFSNADIQTAEKALNASVRALQQDIQIIEKGLSVSKNFKITCDTKLSLAGTKTSSITADDKKLKRRISTNDAS